jgi:purine-binding chemotaxis protein CheW
MKKSVQLVVFSLDDQRYALHLEAVNRIVPAVEVTPLPKSPDIILGVINVQGSIIPVINIRRRFRIPERELSIADRMIVARTPRRAVGLIVDTVTGIVEIAEQDVIRAESIIPGTSYLEGLVKVEDGIVLIHDLDKFLSLDEEQALDTALTKVNNTV